MDTVKRGKYKPKEENIRKLETYLKKLNKTIKTKTRRTDHGNSN